MIETVCKIVESYVRPHDIHDRKSKAIRSSVKRMVIEQEELNTEGKCGPASNPKPSTRAERILLSLAPHFPGPASPC